MNKPLHNEITDVLRERIAAGDWAVGERLPTEPVLAREIGVSRATLREALQQLDAEGMLIRKHGVGTFVRSATPGISLSLTIPRSVTVLIESQGLSPSTSFMKITSETVFPDDVERMSVAPGSKVYRIERIRTANSQPVAYTIDTVPAWVMTKYPEKRADGTFSLIEHITYRCGIRFAESEANLNPLHGITSVADKLEIDSASHIFFFEGVDHDVDGRPVMFSREYFAPWIFRFTVTRTPVRDGHRPV
jgi:GntR family transcriptional regulator